MPQIFAPDYLQYSAYHEMSAYVAHSSPTLCLRQDHTPRYHDKLKDTVISPPACIYIDHTAESLIYKDFQGKK